MNKNSKPRRELLTGIAACALLILVAVLVSFGNRPAQPAETTPRGEMLSGTWYADIVVEGYGTITVALDAEVAPVTVTNFVELARSGFYDGLTFHRIMQGSPFTA